MTESEADPVAYFRENLGGAVALLDAMRATGIPRIAFSSTAAVYGDHGNIALSESAQPRPASVYGSSKLAADVVLAEHARLHQMTRARRASLFRR